MYFIFGKGPIINICLYFLYINAHLVGMNQVSFLPRLHRDHKTCGMGCAVSPKACLPSSEINLCPMQQECR